MSFTKIIHITDVHLPYHGPFRVGDFFNKRAFGLLSWLRKRQYTHSLAILDDLVCAIRTIAPDKILISGDLVNFALPNEFEKARLWLEQLAPAQDILFVPGNHDFYVKLAQEHSLEKLGEYFFVNDDFVGYPFRKSFASNIAIIGLNTGIPTMVPFARGKISANQFEIADGWIKEYRQQGKFIIIMLHHPPLADQNGFLRGLPASNYRDLMSLFHRASPCVVIHGHNHVNTERFIKVRKNEGDCEHHGGFFVFGTATASGILPYRLPRISSSFRLFTIKSLPKPQGLPEIEASLYIHNNEGKEYKIAESKKLNF